MTESRGTPENAASSMRQPTRSFRFQLALRWLEDSLSAAEIERGRLADDEWKIDATFFVYALRNLLRSGELAARSAPDAAASDIQRQIDRFKVSVPGLVKLRDVLEHFDDYLEMKGNLQHPGIPPSKRKPDAAIDPWQGKRRRRAPPGSFGFWAARQNDNDLLVGAGELELRVDQAIEAASRMAAAILKHAPR